MKNNIPETFHRLPFRCSREIINQWLLVLQLDINTPIETLRKKDYRVCSDHFDQGDFNVPTTRNDIPKRVFLRKHAIPKAVTLQVAAERVEVMHFWLYSTEMLVATTSRNFDLSSVSYMGLHFQRENNELSVHLYGTKL